MGSRYLDPGAADAHVNLAAALKLGGDLPSAVSALRTALDLDPRHVDVPLASSGRESERAQGGVRASEPSEHKGVRLEAPRVVRTPLLPRWEKGAVVICCCGRRGCRFVDGN